MFCVLFDVHPKPAQRDAYLGLAKMLRPELEQIDGFVDNIRYRSLTRDGWLLSLSSWRDEKAVIRWRTTMRHHQAQEKGRNEIFADYHLRVGEITEAGEGATVILLDAKGPGDAQKLGVDSAADGLASWDLFEAILAPGEVIAMTSWRTAAAAEAFERHLTLADGVRLRRIRVVRDYGMFDRREAPQFYPEIPRGFNP